MLFNRSGRYEKFSQSLFLPLFFIKRSIHEVGFLKNPHGYYMPLIARKGLIIHFMTKVIRCKDHHYEDTLPGFMCEHLHGYNMRFVKIRS